MDLIIKLRRDTMERDPGFPNGNFFPLYTPWRGKAGWIRTTFRLVEPTSVGFREWAKRGEGSFPPQENHHLWPQDIPRRRPGLACDLKDRRYNGTHTLYRVHRMYFLSTCYLIAAEEECGDKR